MATIISNRDTCDGYRVVISTGGRQHILHFNNEPTIEDRTETIKQFEFRKLNEIATEVVIESEEVLNNTVLEEEL